MLNFFNKSNIILAQNIITAITGDDVKYRCVIAGGLFAQSSIKRTTISSINVRFKSGHHLNTNG